MKAYAIVMTSNQLSQAGYHQLKSSSRAVGNEFDINLFEAYTDRSPLSDELAERKIRWTYPWEGEIIEPDTGMKLRAYETRNRKARIACFLSHYRLWEKCYEEREDFLILEHDAMFVRKFTIDTPPVKFIMGINDPRGATRKSKLYHDMIQEKRDEGYMIPVPRIDDPNIPQGLAGNSAYYITPKAAQWMLDLTKRVGSWPNDALMCYQMVPFVYVSTTYYTRIQGLPSTTTR